MSPEQNPGDLENIVCHHTKMANCLVDPTFLIVGNEALEDDIKIVLEKNGKGTKSQHLIAVYLEKNVTFLYTTGKQTTPRCSSCSCFNCKCYQFYKKTLKNRKSNENNTEENSENFGEEVSNEINSNLSAERCK